jgi:hypothetical protein
MTLIGAKHLQQAVFEMAASTNRAAGSGGGSGFTVASFLGAGQDNNADTIAATTYTVVPGVTVTFSVARAVYIAIAVSSIAKIVAGGGMGLMHPFYDGIDQGLFIGLWDPANTAYSTVSAFTIIGGNGFTPAPFSAGTHTIDLRVKITSAGSTWTNDVTTLQVFALG